MLLFDARTGAALKTHLSFYFNSSPDWSRAVEFPPNADATLIDLQTGARTPFDFPARDRDGFNPLMFMTNSALWDFKTNRMYDVQTMQTRWQYQGNGRVETFDDFMVVHENGKVLIVDQETGATLMNLTRIPQHGLIGPESGIVAAATTRMLRPRIPKMNRYSFAVWKATPT